MDQNDGDNQVIVEHRTYQLETSAVARYFAAFGQAGYDLQSQHMAHCVGHYVTEIGPHSQIVALWQHDSYAARSAGRARLNRQAEWRDIVARVSPLVRNIESKLLVRSPVWTG